MLHVSCILLTGQIYYTSLFKKNAVWKHHNRLFKAIWNYSNIPSLKNKKTEILSFVISSKKTKKKQTNNPFHNSRKYLVPKAIKDLASLDKQATST